MFMKKALLILVTVLQVLTGADHKEVFTIDSNDPTYHDQQGITIVSEEDNSRYYISDSYEEYDYMIDLHSDSWAYDDDFISIFFTEDLSKILVVEQVDHLKN